MANRFLQKKKTQPKGGSHAPATGTLKVSPVTWRTSEGLFTGDDGTWLYRQIPARSLAWAEGHEQLSAGRDLDALLAALAQVDDATVEREIHVLAHRFDVAPGSNPLHAATLRDFHAEVLRWRVPEQRVLLGVKVNASRPVRSTAQEFTSTVTRLLAQHGPDLERYAVDLDRLLAIFAQHGAVAPDRLAVSQALGWFGDGDDHAMLEVGVDRLVAHTEAGPKQYEMTVLSGFEDQTMTAPAASQWVADLLTTTAGPRVVSVRGRLRSFGEINKAVRKNVKRRVHDVAERGESRDAVHYGLLDENAAEHLDATREVHSLLATGEGVAFVDLSVVAARQVVDADADRQQMSWRDLQLSRFGIEHRILRLRQHEALVETLPTAGVRCNPFLQAAATPLVSQSGILDGPALGDAEGTVYLGISDPSESIVMLDPAGANKASRPALEAVLGSSGAGKTFFMLAQAAQEALQSVTD
ncbi:MAG: hypothetical protein GY882_14370, partial [Actinomycetia bacterium]|nr:hypothetical protein [Actinomycetes bacterium]